MSENTMITFLSIFAATFLFSIYLFFEITQVEKKAIAQGYGPESHVNGSLGAQGTLVCVNADAPTLNRSISFPYQFQAKSRMGDLTGRYEYASERSKMVKPIYRGALYFRFRNNHVKGRTQMGGLRAIEGTVDPGKAELSYGYPKGSLLSLLKGSFGYSVDRGGNVHFTNTAHSGSISENSKLSIQGNRMTGRVLHGPQTTWAVEVDVAIAGIEPEQATLAVIMACNDILATHHSD